MLAAPDSELSYRKCNLIEDHVRTSRRKLNSIYHGTDDKPVGGQYTYWTASSDFFLYYPVGHQRWHISPKFDSNTGEDNYIKAKYGAVIGIAGQTPSEQFSNLARLWLAAFVNN